MHTFMALMLMYFPSIIQTQTVSKFIFKFASGTNDVIFINYVIDITSARSKIDCSVQCIDKAACVTYSFNPKIGTCYLRSEQNFDTTNQSPMVGFKSYEMITDDESMLKISTNLPLTNTGLEIVPIPGGIPNTVSSRPTTLMPGISLFFFNYLLVDIAFLIN